MIRSFAFVVLLFVQRGAVHKKQMPFWRRLATRRPRCQGRRFCVHRSEAQTLDSTSGRLGAVFAQEGQAKKRLFGLEFSVQVWGFKNREGE